MNLLSPSFLDWKFKSVLYLSLSHVRLLGIPWTVSTRLLGPWNFPGKNTGMGCHTLLQGLFLTQGSTQISCIAGRFFTTWEALKYKIKVVILLKLPLFFSNYKYSVVSYFGMPVFLPSN